MHSMSIEKFPGMTAVSLSHLAQVVFPNTSKKRRGKGRVTYIIGIELKPSLPSHSVSLTGMSTSATLTGMSTSAALTGMSISAPLTGMSTSAPLTGMSTSVPRTGTSTVAPLTGTSTSAPLTGMSTSAPLTGMSTSAHPTGGALISASPTGTLTSAPLTESAHSPMSALLLELQTEREKREALEHEVHILKRRLEERSSAADYKQTLFSEIDSAVLSRHLLVHGPDTIDRFNGFSMSSVITELESTCPEVYSVVQELGSTQRHATDGNIPDEELKGVMAVCTLLNARSARVKGLQLMISLMLVARASGKQVYTCMHVYYM